MKKLSYFNLAAKLFTTHGFPSALMKLEAKIDSLAAPSGATTLFLQIHDVQIAPANGAVPVASWPVVADSDVYKEFKRGELYLVNGLYIAVSTTEATLTLGTSNNKMSMVSAELTEAEVAVTLVGDLTTAVTERQIWSEATGPKRLRKLQIIFGATGGTKYAMLFGRDDANVVDGDKPLEVLTSGDNETKSLDFGPNGREVRQAVAGVEKVGCFIVISTTLATVTESTDVEHYIRAEYV